MLSLFIARNRFRRSSREETNRCVESGCLHEALPFLTMLVTVKFVLITYITLAALGLHLMD